MTTFDELNVTEAIEAREIALEKRFNKFMDELANSIMEAFSEGLPCFNGDIPEYVNIEGVKKALTEKGFRVFIDGDEITVFLP